MFHGDLPEGRYKGWGLNYLGLGFQSYLEQAMLILPKKLKMELVRCDPQHSKHVGSLFGGLFLFFSELLREPPVPLLH